jgi:hypothetical protein
MGDGVGGIQEWMDTRKGVVGGREGMKVVKVARGIGEACRVVCSWADSVDGLGQLAELASRDIVPGEPGSCSTWHPVLNSCIGTLELPANSRRSQFWYRILDAWDWKSPAASFPRPASRVQ